MQYIIKNPTQDMDGNVKENIFIAYDEEGNILGNAYVYPAINHHQTYETPQMIYFDVHIGIEIEDLCKHSLQLQLFDVVMERAKTIRKERQDLKTRLYTGCINDEYKLECLKEQGFDDDCTLIMSLECLEGDFSLDGSLKAFPILLDKKESFKAYKEMYNELFITPLDEGLLLDLSNNEGFECVRVELDGHPIGGCTFYVADGIGYIETMYVLPDNMKKGNSRHILSYALNQLRKTGAKSVELEVWQLNKRAIKLYESYGFKRVARNIMFPGIEL